MNRKLATICAVTLLMAISGGSALAAGRGGGGGHAGGGHAGGGGAWRGGAGHGNWHGHSHGYWRGGVFIGLGAYGYWPYWGYPYGYAYPSYYSYPTDPYYVPPVYMEQDPMLPRNAMPNNPGAFWYFCPDSRQYYPSVQSCPSDWQRVPSTPPPG